MALKSAHKMLLKNSSRAVSESGWNIEKPNSSALPAKLSVRHSCAGLIRRKLPAQTA